MKFIDGPCKRKADRCLKMSIKHLTTKNESIVNVVNLEKAGDDGERADGDDHQHGGAGPTEQG